MTRLGKRAKKVLGACCIATPFVVLFVFCIATMSIKETLLAWGLSLATIGIIIVGVNLSVQD